MVPFTGGLKLPPDLLEALNAQAEASGLSRQALIRSALRQYLVLPDPEPK
jgi:predicted DNA binding CopG/RHH family protein